MHEIDSKLFQLNKRGIFFGPGESESSFFQRAEAEQNCRIEPPALIESIFDSIPDWIETIEQSKGLFPWEGAATWIEEKPGGCRSCQIQFKNTRLSRLYPKEEVLAHEMVHAMRLMFDESRFEEILAYRTSKNKFRRYFGPLFSSSKESKGFFVGTVISWVIYSAEIVFDIQFFEESILLLPLLLIGFGMMRLIRSQRVFASALLNLKKTTSSKLKPLSVLLRLTDKEIELFAKSSPQEICAFASDQKEKSLRWKQIYLAYFLRP